jgi:hypothetical protein
MSFAKIKGILTSRIGRSVAFGPPRDVHAKGGTCANGRIIDEVWANPDVKGLATHPENCDNHCWGDYAFCSQLIEWEDGKRTIRLAYHRRRCGEDVWEYASQMTVNAPPQIIRSMCEDTLAKRSWFDGTRH